MIKCENACPRGKFDGCCHKCPEFHTCPDSCEENPNACGEATFDEETALQEFKNTQLATLNAIAFSPVNDIVSKEKPSRFIKNMGCRFPCASVYVVSANQCSLAKF